MDLFEIANALAGVYYLATTEGDQPHVRPFDGAVVVDNKLYIGAGKKKAVFEQMKFSVWNQAPFVSPPKLIQSKMKLKTKNTTKLWVKLIARRPLHLSLKI